MSGLVIVPVTNAGPLMSSSRGEQAKEIHAAIEELVGLSSLTEPAYDLMKPPYTYFDGTFELYPPRPAGNSRANRTFSWVDIQGDLL